MAPILGMLVGITAQGRQQRCGGRTLAPDLLGKLHEPLVGGVVDQQLLQQGRRFLVATQLQQGAHAGLAILQGGGLKLIEPVQKVQRLRLAHRRQEFGVEADGADILRSHDHGLLGLEDGVHQVAVGGELACLADESLGLPILVALAQRSRIGIPEHGQRQTEQRGETAGNPQAARAAAVGMRLGRRHQPVPDGEERPQQQEGLAVVALIRVDGLMGEHSARR